MTHPTRILASLTVAFALVAPTQSGAVVPAKSCGTVKVGSKSYTVKADQIRCTTAKKYALTLLRTSKRPSGYTCVKGSRTSKLAYNCVNRRASPDRTLLIIKR